MDFHRLNLNFIRRCGMDSASKFTLAKIRTRRERSCMFRLVKARQVRGVNLHAPSLLFELMILFAKSGFGHKARGEA